MKKSNWLTFFLNGIIAFLFGIMALFLSQALINALSKYFGAAMLILGGIMLYISVRKSKKDTPFVMMMIEAIVAMVIGVIMLFFTRQAIEMFAILIGVWAFVMGIMQIVVAIQLWKQLKQNKIFLFSGLMAIVLGVILFSNPLGTVVFLTRLAGFIALVVGALLLFFAWQISRKPEEPKAG
jgi:uncharacterized membrane protein HdeD (DUF308 family)